MDRRHYQDQLKQLLNQRNGYLVLSLGLLVLTGILSLIIYSQIGQQRMVVVPPGIDQPFSLSDTHVSASYLRQMSVFWATLRLSVNADSAPYQHRTLLRHVAPEAHAALKKRLAQERQRLQHHHISTTFYPTDTEVNATQLTATVKGELTTYVGQEQSKSHDVAYRLQYRRSGSRLLLTQFQAMDEGATS